MELQNSYIYTKALALANKELRKAVKLLLDNEDKWQNMLDLKLHEASRASIDFEYNNATVTFSDEAQSSWFYHFCDIEYQNFIEDLRDNFNIDFEQLRDNVRYTSKFYLGKLHAVMLTDTLAEASDTYMYGGIKVKIIDGLFSVDVDGSQTNYDDFEDFVNALLDFADYIYDEVEASLKPIITVYDYIEDYKKNQVENFRDFVQDNWINNCE
jgi:hypothetical protein